MCWTDHLSIDPLLAARGLALIWSNPTLEEAVYLGSFPYADDQLGIGAEPLARTLPWQHFARIFKSKNSKLYRVIWIEGCLRLTPEPRSSLLRLANYVKHPRSCVVDWRMKSLSRKGIASFEGAKRTSLS
jgi:hypothetical protein